MKQIVCVKWGSAYGPEYVNRLYGMVSRNITPPFRVVCLTDSREGLRAEVECFDLPELGVPHPTNTIGKWRKQVLWGRQVPGLDGVALFIDLDSVIVGNIDPYFEIGADDDVYLARNWARPLANLGQTSVFRFKVGRHAYVLDGFLANPQGIADKHRFEQHYVTATIHGGIKFWPEDWTCHFRLHCLPTFPLNYFATASIPKNARIVTFPGGPKPDAAMLGRWSGERAAGNSPWQHIAAAFGPQRGSTSLRRYLRGYVRPVEWIATHWRD